MLIARGCFPGRFTMTERLSLQRLTPLGLAVLFAAATLSYGGFWAYSVRWQAAVSMGFAFGVRGSGPSAEP